MDAARRHLFGIETRRIGPSLARVALASFMALACGSSDESGSGPGGNPTSVGVCSGSGWRDTCQWFTSCSGGEFQLLCDTNDAEVEALLQDAGVALDESTCACVEGDAVARAVPRDESFCRDQFEDTDDERHAKARARVEAICGWDL